MGHQQAQTTLEMDNSSENSIVNGTAKENIQSKRHEILLGQRRNTTKPFPHILGGRKEKLSRLYHKIPPYLTP